VRSGRTPGSRGGEAGFTLLETLVAMTLMLVVFSAVVITLVVFNNQTNQTTSHIGALDTANTGIERIARDIRQSTMSSSAPSYTLTVGGGGTTLSLYLEERAGGSGTAALHNVSYTCAADAAPSTNYNCKRTDTTCATLPCTAGTPAANVSSTAILVAGLTSAQVFTATGTTNASSGPMISAVQVSLSPAISGSTLPAVIQETVVPRNCQIGGC
jgi:prepilin-type N-terminal cleavage/methylation domain-containing protein